MKKEEPKQKEELDLLVSREIRSWDSFKYALREENAILFDQMLKECQENEDKGIHFANAFIGP